MKYLRALVKWIVEEATTPTNSTGPGSRPSCNCPCRRPTGVF